MTDLINDSDFYLVFNGGAVADESDTKQCCGKCGCDSCQKKADEDYYMDAEIERMEMIRGVEAQEWGEEDA